MEPCPQCKKNDVVLIDYGYPADEDGLANYEGPSGLFAPGGCCIDGDSPKYYCRNCEHTRGNL